MRLGASHLPYSPYGSSCNYLAIHSRTVLWVNAFDLLFGPSVANLDPPLTYVCGTNRLQSNDKVFVELDAQRTSEYVRIVRLVIRTSGTQPMEAEGSRHCNTFVGAV